MDMNDFLKIANETSPELIEKTAVALAVLEKISPEHAEEVRGDMEKVLARPIEHMEKNAGAAAAVSKVWEATPTPLKAGLGALGAGLGAALATDLYDVARRGLTKGRNFKRIMDANPELSKGYEKRLLSGSYSTLHRYAPEFTADALMGGTILKAMAETPDNQLNIIKTLLDSRKNLIEAKGKQFSPGRYPLKDINDFNQTKKSGGGSSGRGESGDTKSGPSKMWGGNNL